MLEYINLFMYAIISGNYLWFIVIYCCIIACIVKTQWTIVSQPRCRSKFIIFSFLSITALTLWATDLMKWPSSGIILILLFALAAVFYHSYSGTLLWPCSSIFRDVSNHFKTNEPEMAEKILHRYKRLFLDPTEKYSYYCKLAFISGIKSNIHQSIKLLDKIDVDTLNYDEQTQLRVLRANYFTQLGDHKKALQIIERLANIPDKFLLQRQSSGLQKPLLRTISTPHHLCSQPAIQLSLSLFFKFTTRSLCHYRFFPMEGTRSLYHTIHIL